MSLSAKISHLNVPDTCRNIFSEAIMLQVSGASLQSELEKNFDCQTAVQSVTLLSFTKSYITQNKYF